MIGPTLRTARQRAGLSLAQLGARVGLSDAYLHDVEHGRRALVPARWPAFAAALGLTIDAMARAHVDGLAGRVEVDAATLTRAQRAAILRDVLTQVRASLEIQRSAAP